VEFIVGLSKQSKVDLGGGRIPTQASGKSRLKVRLTAAMTSLAAGPNARYEKGLKFFLPI